MTFEERCTYFQNETEEQKAKRHANRKDKTCAVCKQIGHFACDPECPQAPDYFHCKPGDSTAVEKVTLVSDFSDEE